MLLDGDFLNSAPELYLENSGSGVFVHDDIMIVQNIVCGIAELCVLLSASRSRFCAITRWMSVHIMLHFLWFCDIWSICIRQHNMFKPTGSGNIPDMPSMGSENLVRRHALVSMPSTSFDSIGSANRRPAGHGQQSCKFTVYGSVFLVIIHCYLVLVLAL